MTDARARSKAEAQAGAAEDARLVARARHGDRDAFNDLVHRHQRKLYNFAYRLCGNYDQANDIAAEAFVRVYTALASFRGDAAFLTWLFRIAYNVYLDDRKRARSRPQQSLEEVIELEESSVARQIQDPSPSPQEVVEADERTRLLQEAIGSLPDYQRIMVVMYHTEGRSYEDIAEVLDLPIGTVKSRLNRARLSLREKLTPLKEHFLL